jgi:hypothetical protein
MADHKKKNKSGCFQVSITAANFNSDVNNRRQKRLRADRKLHGVGYDLEDSVLCNSLSPSSFPTPVFLNGGQDPALCFGPSCLRPLKYMDATINCSTDNFESNLCYQNGYALDRSDRNLEQYVPPLLKSARIPTPSEHGCSEAYSVFEGRLVERQTICEKVSSKSETHIHTIGNDSLISLVKEMVTGIFDAIHSGESTLKYSGELFRASPLNSPSVVSSNDINNDQLLLCNEFEGATMSRLSFSPISDQFLSSSRQETAILRSLSVILRGTALQLARNCKKIDTSSSGCHRSFVARLSSDVVRQTPKGLRFQA